MGVLLAHQQVVEFFAVLGAAGVVFGSCVTLITFGSIGFWVNVTIYVQVFGEFFDAL